MQSALPITAKGSPTGCPSTTRRGFVSTSCVAKRGPPALYKAVDIALEKHMECQDGRPYYSKVKSMHNIRPWRPKGIRFSADMAAEGTMPGRLMGPQGPQSQREVLLPHCSTWATYPSPGNLGSSMGQAQPPLRVIGRVPLMRRGAIRGPASTIEYKWLWQPYLKNMAW